MSVTTVLTQVPGLAGLSVVAYSQGGPNALGPQQAGTTSLLAITTDTSKPLDPVTSQVTQVACTYPAPPVVLEVACANTAGDYDTVMPFAARVTGIAYNLTAGASTNAADTFKLTKVDLGGNATDISVEQTVNGTAQYGVVYGASLNPTNGTLLAGETLRVTVAKNTNVGGTAIVTLVPVVG